MNSFWPSGVVLGIDGLPLRLASFLARVFVRTTQQMVEDNATECRGTDNVERKCRYGELEVACAEHQHDRHRDEVARLREIDAFLDPDASRRGGNEPEH